MQDAGGLIDTATVTINLAPDNPYQSVLAQFLVGRPSHFLSVSGIVRALSELWPLLAVTYVVCALSERKLPATAIT